VNEIEIENCFKFEDIFNNFAIHQFKVKEVDSKLWESQPEPKYSSDDLELVQDDSN
jgi:phosphopantetheinyl transferase (holo-ACP synthase)